LFEKSPRRWQAPHGDYLADARAKVQALTSFAGQFGDRFVRIESVAKVDDGSLRVLDLGTGGQGRGPGV
jgi:hypothetical protein